MPLNATDNSTIPPSIKKFLDYNKIIGMQIWCSNDGTVSEKLFTRKAHYSSWTDTRYTEDTFRLFIHQILWLLLCSGYTASAKSHQQRLGIYGTGAIKAAKINTPIVIGYCSHTQYALAFDLMSV